LSFETAFENVTPSGIGCTVSKQNSHVRGPLRECRSIRSGASGLPYYCTPLVCVSDVIDSLTMWRYNKPKNQKTVCNGFTPLFVPNQYVIQGMGERRLVAEDATDVIFVISRDTSQPVNL